MQDEISTNSIIDIENEKTFSDIVGHRRKFGSTQNSFQDIFGDLSDYIFSEELNLSSMKLNSLKGVPKSVRGFFQLDNDEFIESLEFLPKNISGFISVESSENLKSLRGIENLNKNNPDPFNLYFSKNPKLTDISSLDPKTVLKAEKFAISATRVSAGDIVKVSFLKRRHSGSFHFLTSNFKEDTLEKLYKVLEKLSFDLEKFEKVLLLMR